MKTCVTDTLSFGARIREIRKAQKLTQQELAMIAHTAPRFISDLENGKATCQIGKALQVANCLGVRVELSTIP
jgi:y4mF family transcriptional regulator